VVSLVLVLPLLAFIIALNAAGVPRRSNMRMNTAVKAIRR
jgi:hypothetical protein